jgi:hypothetical protein
MINLRGISTNWFENQFCPSTRLSICDGLREVITSSPSSDAAVRCDITHLQLFCTFFFPPLAETNPAMEGKVVRSSLLDIKTYRCMEIVD